VSFVILYHVWNVNSSFLQGFNYLVRFIYVLKKYTGENNSDVYGFISWWEENKQNNTIIVPDEEDAIRVMTIHKAKGLQAPVVFIPFANWEFGLSANRNMIWVSSPKPPFDTQPAYFVKASSALKDSYFAQDYNEEAAQTYLDNLNLMYVAFTRAEEKLFVGIPKKGKESLNAGQVIYSTLTGNPALAEGFDTESYTYENGIIYDTIVRTETRSGYNSYKIGTMNSSNIAEKIIVKPEFEDFVPENKTRLEELKNRGIILHKALSILNNSSIEEIENTSQKSVILGLITEVQMPELINELKSIIAIDKVKKWFDSEGVMNEREIILPEGSIYRPDKVVLNADKAIIVDYKSGGKRTDHAVQIKAYGEILNRMGYKQIEMNLFYLNDLQIEVVQ